MFIVYATCSQSLLWAATAGSEHETILLAGLLQGGMGLCQVGYGLRVRQSIKFRAGWCLLDAAAEAAEAGAGTPARHG